MASDQSSLDAVVATSSAGGASQIEPAALSGETSNAGKDDAARAADHDAVDHDAAGHDAGGAAASQSTQPLRTPVNTASIGDAVVSDPGLAMVPEASALASASGNAATPAASEQTAAAAPAASDFARIADPAQIYVDDDQSVTSISRPGDSGSPHSNPPSEGTAPALAASASNPDSVTAAINPSTTSADPKAAQESLAKLGADAGSASAPQSSQNWRARDRRARARRIANFPRPRRRRQRNCDRARKPSQRSLSRRRYLRDGVCPRGPGNSSGRRDHFRQRNIARGQYHRSTGERADRAGQRQRTRRDGRRENFHPHRRLRGAGFLRNGWNAPEPRRCGAQAGACRGLVSGRRRREPDRRGPGRERYQTPAQKPSDQAKEIFIMNEVPL